jgi:hypothetical protein
MTSLRARTIRLAHANPILRPYLVPLLVKVAALPNGTVKMFLMVLSSKITQYDKRVSVRDPNIYRLGLLLEAHSKAEDAAKRLDILDKDDADSLGKLKALISRNFTYDFPPAKNTVKQIDAFLATGKLPSLVG